jgi:hypothetical protein
VKRVRIGGIRVAGIRASMQMEIAISCWFFAVSYDILQEAPLKKKKGSRKKEYRYTAARKKEEKPDAVPSMPFSEVYSVPLTLPSTC